MKKLLIFLLIITAFTGAGCTKLLEGSQAPKVKIVTQAEILITNGTEAHQVLYNDPHKISKLLNYLRRIESWDMPEQDALTAEGPRYRIVLSLSNGSSKTYEQLGLDCFKADRSDWKSISKESAIQLPLILAIIPSDTI